MVRIDDFHLEILRHRCRRHETEGNGGAKDRAEQGPRGRGGSNAARPDRRESAASPGFAQGRPPTAARSALKRRLLINHIDLPIQSMHMPAGRQRALFAWPERARSIRQSSRKRSPQRLAGMLATAEFDLSAK
jgi:hypothetical protein